MVFKQLHPWILGSSSPRRKELFQNQGFDFETFSPQTDESVLSHETPLEYVLRVSAEKNDRVGSAHPSFGGLIITADTTVVLGGDILGKPGNPEKALGFLERLNGQTHEVYTAYRVVHAETGVSFSSHAVTQVEFFRFAEGVLRAYAGSGDPLDKAGGYSLQGTGTFLVKSIRGSFNNVIGFPVEDFVGRMLEKNWLR